MVQDGALFLTEDQQMQQVLIAAKNIALSRATVLIMGESGTGKEVLSQFIHLNSRRAKERFIALNCAALPEGLLESELFGCEKGAFTGAVATRPGKFELAHRGTFLLDEISELPLLLQAKILRVIQEGELQRLGSQTVQKVDVRLLCTSNRDLLDMVKRGLFRQDLYYRLNVIPLRTIPLRHRKKDIRFLSQHFIIRFCKQNEQDLKILSESALQKLMQWGWPGNVRELENVIQRLVVLHKGSHIEAEDIHLAEDGSEISLLKDFGIQALDESYNLSEMERRAIGRALEHTEQNRTRAAELLGISVRTLRNKLNEYKNIKVDEGVEL
jgi:transcriptional regulator with PAS, ATPase and Fis domain